MLVLGGIAAVIACALVVATSALHRANVHLAKSVEVVRVAEEAVVDLLTHQRTADGLRRAAIEGALRARLRTLEDELVPPSHRDLLGRVRASVDAYENAARVGNAEGASKAFEAAFGGLSELIGATLESARHAGDRSADLDAAANITGIVSALVFALALVAAWWWLELRVFAPTRELASTMGRFAGGDRSVRAADAGAAELREIAQLFNGMASAIAAHREALLASIGGIAHDLRSPLGTLKLGLSTVPDDDGRHVPLLKRQVHRIERMVTDLLDSARIEAGKLELQTRPHDLRDVVRAISTASELMLSPKQRLEVVVPDQPVISDCDASRIEQVLENLVSNAVKYSPSGGTVLVELTSDESCATIRVADQGIGIAEHERRHLFTPFRRAEGTLGIPGVGLGLYVCRRIVEAHGGTIDVQSEVGQGSTFIVTLPREPAAAR